MTAAPTGGPVEPVASTGGDDAEAHGWSFWIGLAVGGAVIAYGVWGVFHDHLDTNPPFLLKWVLGLLVAHDFIVAPLVVGGVLLVRLLPERVRHPVGGALALSAIVAVFSIPLVRAFGRHDLNSSTLPHDYLPNLLIILAAIWIVAIATIVWRGVRTGA